MEARVSTAYRTHHCGALRKEHIGQEVILSGWVRVFRKMGAVLFVDLSDRYGITQIILEGNTLEGSGLLSREAVIKVRGRVRERSHKNPTLPTGSIEIIAEAVELLNPSLTPPFTLREDTDGGEALRMEYRYLDLRRPPLQANLIFRHRVTQAFRSYLNAQAFLDIETPFLIKSTPEGARDFVVPSRMHPAHFYALPQSPQLFKQLLMLGGYDRYYQIVRCFRDEDLRADRQPEFTQVDCEMSFVAREDILSMFERGMKYLMQEVKGIKIAEDFPRMSYAEAMSRYGTDKPDTRFGMELLYMDAKYGKALRAFPPFADHSAQVALLVDKKFSRKEYTLLATELSLEKTGMRIAQISENEAGIKSSFDTFIPPPMGEEIFKKAGGARGKTLLILSGEDILSLQKTAGQLRLHIGTELGLRDTPGFHFLWVTDFPLFEWDPLAARYLSLHHPFTAPVQEDLALLSDPKEWKNLRANAYDMVLNGTEIGGGSLRINDKAVQEKIFKILGFTQAQSTSQFGFLLEAFQYGAPPHGGIAFGLDRICALLQGSETIRDFIAFPKNNSARDTMLKAPSPLDPTQLQELHLHIAQDASEDP